jgi:tetratricopeptide (TPR) repeat protein
VPARELLAWDGTGRRPGLDYYAEAFVLVHWLAHRRAEGFAAFQARLAAGGDPEAAWTAVFPDLDPARPGALEALDETLEAYARGPVENDRRTVQVPVAVGFFEHRVPPEEVHAIRLVLWPYGPARRRETLLAEIHEALAEDPAHPVALQALAAEERLDPVVLARRAAAGHPGDARAWTFLGTALGRDAPHEREAAFRRAAELAPRNAAALHNLAQELLAQGRSGEALPCAREATALAPWSPPVLAGHAAVLSDLGRCADAIVLQRRALESLPERAGPESRTELLAGLEAYARQCGAAEVR